MIIRLTGGLGNQMFQYAFGRSVSIRNKCELVLDATRFEATYVGDTPRSLRINNLNIKGRFAKSDEVRTYSNPLSDTIGRIIRKLNPEKPYAFNDKTMKKAHCHSYLVGLWQNEKYFNGIADTIREDFLPRELLSPAAERMHERIRVSNDPVSVHIRRGDFVTNKHASTHHGTLPISYYQKAFEYIMDHIGSHFTVFVFSDDIQWAREHAAQYIPDCADIVFVSDNDIPDYEELTLMRLCRHHIIANSSFSWWGAWLNPHKEKIVIAPKQWVADAEADTSDITPASWIRM